MFGAGGGTSIVAAIVDSRLSTKPFPKKQVQMENFHCAAKSP